MYLRSDYKFNLPDERIAQQPAERREASRLLKLNRSTGHVTHHGFSDIEHLLKANDLVVINNTRVIPARLNGHKETGGKVEVLIIDYAHGMVMLEKNGIFRCDCMVRASKSPKPGTWLLFDEGLRARVEDNKQGIVDISFYIKEHSGADFVALLNRIGEVPLPPYIHRDGPVKGEDDRENYQTVYATQEGAVAAPTAGLHFTESLMKRLEEKGVEFVPLTLHVGYGTFVPVRVDDIREHKIHSEYFSISDEASQRINRAKDEKRRVVAVGTTSVRTLEYAADAQGRVIASSGTCDLFIYPGYEFKIVDAMITNFHLPESTLLMLVSAFSGRENILDAYREAVASGYRFFSYGDAMLLE